MHLSNRKLKMSKGKRTIATGGVNTKLIFDEEGEAHQLHELEDFLVRRKEEAREKKRGGKRKRKERERTINGDDEGGPTSVIEPAEEGGSYVSPEFGPPSESDEEPLSFSPRKKAMFGECPANKRLCAPKLCHWKFTNLGWGGPRLCKRCQLLMHSVLPIRACHAAEC
ncbi:hypothetical protein D9756_009808 [Leucocoprinus leucothites]|uniref:Uncharacterized protein n=1 Tax=Leucocoprinus leucothites TaxID=201217 RepID=A0A8H5CVU6_9AGAR|nr:hypothetical protein D9756_009808 [Leucoagaricus leucothites]